MRRYRGFTLPLLLIVAGAIALLANLNLVSLDSLYRVLDLWPLVLILIGLEIVLRGSVPPRAGSLIGLIALTVAVVGAVAYVTFGPVVRPVSAVFDTSGPLAETAKASLELNFGAAELDVHGEALGSTLYKLHAEYVGQKPDISFDSGSGTLSISDTNQGFPFFFRPGLHRRVQVTLNSTIPWAVSVSGGALRTVLDLSAIQLSGLDVSGGANNLTVTLGPPMGTVAVTVSGGATSVAIRRPAGVAAQVNASGGANSVRLDGRQLSSFGDTGAATPGYDSATDRYEIDVSGGANNVQVLTGS